MPRWNIKKKLSPATKAWKSFTTKLQPKLQKLLQHSLPTAVKAATRRLLVSFSSFLPSKLRAISNPSPRSRQYYSHSHNNNPSYYFNPHHKNLYHHNMAKSQPFYHKSFAAIRVDELFDASASVENNNKGKNPLRTNVHGRLEYSAPGTSQNCGDREGGVSWGRRKSDLYGVEDAWKAVVASSPQLRCVDERAEEFIFKVRQDMKLQKEKSNLEFHEMLARGA